MATRAEVEEGLRRRVQRGFHAGELAPGDRLPSIRALAADLDADHRTVAKAYRGLEREGLVEIRPRSGVYVADQERLGRDDFLLGSTARWVAEILADGWARGIPVPQLAAVVGRCTRSVRLRCGCVDDVVDSREMLVEEAREQFGLDPVPIPLSQGSTASSVEDALADVDLVLASAFHAGIVRRAARGSDVPVVVMTFNPESRARLRRAAEAAPLTVVGVDPAYGDRLRNLLGAEAEIRFLPVDDAVDVAELELPGRLHVSLAARRRLEDVVHAALIEHGPLLAGETARTLSWLIVQENARAT